MKKFIVYLVVVVTLGISGGYYYDYSQSQKYDTLAVPYIEEVLPKLSSWDLDQVKGCMAPEVLRTVSDEQLGGLLKALSQLGELKSIGETSFKNKADGDAKSAVAGNIVTYDIETEYSSGPVMVTLRLLDKGGVYQLYYFNFQSESLAR